MQKISADSYLDLMELAVDAYTPEHMERYLQDVQAKGIEEHGFPRITSNLGVRHHDGQWVYSYGGRYANLAASASNGTARMDADVMREVEPCLHLSCEVSAEGVLITLSGEGDLALALPVFEFDGERTTTIRVAEKVVDVSLDGWICQYETNGAIIDTGLVYGNRNGHYRRFEARRKGPLAVKVTLSCASSD